MLDISHELINKLSLRVTRHPESNSDISVADLVKGILYDRIALTVMLLCTRLGALSRNQSGLPSRSSRTR